MKPNPITLSARIDLVVVTDSVRYRLIVRITSATAGEGEEVPTSGQRLELTPGFIVSEDSTIDLTNSRNARLYSLRGASPGKLISGSVLRDRQQHWVLIDLTGE